MKFYRLFAYNQLCFDIGTIHKNYVEDVDSLVLPFTESLEDINGYLNLQRKELQDLKVDDIIGIMSEVGKLWDNKDYPLRRMAIDMLLKKGAYSRQMIELGLKYISRMYSEDYLKGITDADLYGNRRVLDEFLNLYPGNPALLVRAQPKGIAGHWLSGNTLVIGQISLMRSLVTKNANIVKVSAKEKYFLPIFLESFKDANYRNEEGVTFNGSILSKFVFIIFFDSRDRECNTALSLATDLRIARGGKEAIDTILNLEKRYGTDDIIYGPKYSYMAIGREYLENEELCREIAEKAAIDFSIWDQYACTSPHVAFVERGGIIKPEVFARILAEYMGKVALIIPNDSVSLDNAPSIVSRRIEYDILGQAFYPESTSWTVLFSDQNQGFPRPLFSRVAHVFAVDDIFDTLPYVDKFTQSVTLAVKGKRRLLYSEECTLRGAERCIPVGCSHTMPAGSPWDGFFNCSQMTRWVSTYNDDSEQLKENKLIEF